MKPAPFTFHAPHTIDDLVELLAQLGAGGQSFVGHYPIRQRGTFCGSIAHARQMRGTEA